MRIEAKGLTDRRRQVAGLVAAGLTNKQIAQQLVISPKTVQTHVRDIGVVTGHRGRRGVFRSVFEIRHAETIDLLRRLRRKFVRPDGLAYIGEEETVDAIDRILGREA